MTRLQFMHFALIVSAFVLSAVLIGRLAPPAQADQVLSREHLTVVTARTSTQDESIFVIDNISGRLIIYRPRIDRKKLEVVAGYRLSDIFKNAGAKGGRGRGRR